MVKYYYETEGKYGRREKVMNKDMDYDALRNDWKIIMVRLCLEVLVWQWVACRM